MAKLTPPTPFPFSIQVTLSNSRFCAHKIIAKWRKRPHPCTPPTPKIHLNHTLPFWKQSRRRHHPLTTPNDPSLPGYCQHSNSCGNCLRTCEDTSNQVQGPTYTFQNHTTIFLEDQSITNCHNTTSSHNAPSLTTLSSCPNPLITTTHWIFSKEGRDTKLGSPMHPKPD